MALNASLRRKGTMSDNHPLDTPEILSLIAAVLPRTDLANACAVAKSWFRPFASQLWRSIQPLDFEKRAFVRALPRYQGLVRELVCPLICPVLSRLLHFRSLTAFSPPKVQKDSAEALLSVIQNQRASLEQLNLQLDDVPNLPDMALQAVSTLSRLRSLFLTGYCFDPIGIEFILDHIPTLQELHVVQESGANLSNLKFQPKFLRQWAKERGKKKASYRLRSFGFETLECSFYPLISIVESSADLEQLVIKDWKCSLNVQLVRVGCQELAHTLRQSCPRLKDLQLGCRWIQIQEFCYLLGLERSMSELAQLATANPIPRMALQNRWLALRSLHVFSDHHGDNVGINGGEILNAVLRGRDTLAKTLEELVINHTVLDEQDLTGMVVDLLCQFKKLRIFKGGAAMVRVRHLFLLDPFQRQPAHLLEDGSRGLGLKPWACQDLEFLQVNFVDPYDGWFPLLLDRLFSDKYTFETILDTFAGQYPVYLAIKCHLRTFSNLDQTGIRFSRL